MKGIYFNRDIIIKKYKRTFLIYTALFCVSLGLMLFTKFNQNNYLIFAFIGYYILSIAQNTLIMQKKLKFEEPAILINRDYIELNDFNNFLSLKKEIIQYDEIKYFRMDLDKDNDGFKKNVFIISLKDGKEIIYNIHQFGLTPSGLSELINQVNPNVKILNYGNID